LKVIFLDFKTIENLNEMASIVDPLIKAHKVMVFSKTTCPYCDKAKKVLANYSINDKHIVELDNGHDQDSIQDYLAKITGARTVGKKLSS
jgi:glutaredoxin 3